MSQKKGPLASAAQKANQLSGNIPGEVLKDVKQAGHESIKQVANTPMDMLKGLIGMSDNQSETSSSGDPLSQAQNPGSDFLGQPTAFQQKMIEDQKKRQAMMRHHREMLAKYEQEYKKNKQKQEQLKQQEEVQDDQKKEQVKYEKQQKQKTPMWKRIFGMGGSQEGGKKKF